ncbi:MAG TPA: hypothetical protein VHG91_20360, partial [Longimicrobium sp.]|nr:hypothetical protein [Longimicrobium sp.]
MRLLDLRTLRRVLPPCFAGALLALGAVSLAPPAPLLGQGVEECEADPEICPPPVVTLVPAGGAWSGAEDSTVVTVTVEACGQVAFRSGFEVTVNGDPVPFPFSTGGRAPGCMSTARGARAIGVGTGGAGVVARACNVFGRCGEAVATYGYTKVVPGVEVAPDGGRSVSAPGAAGTYAFTVRNPGSHAADYTLEARCSGAASGCAAPATVRVAAGASASVSVAFQAGGEARRGRVTLDATQANAPAARDSGWVEVVTTGGAPGG